MKIVLITALILTGTRFITSAQNIDPLLAGAIIVANASENSNYSHIKDNQTAIQRAQLATIVVVDQVNQIQNKIYKGLMQVSSVLKNAFQIKECLGALNDILSYQGDMLSEGKQNPLALGCELKIESEIVDKSAAYYADISAVILKAVAKDMLID